MFRNLFRVGCGTLPGLFHYAVAQGIAQKGRAEGTPVLPPSLTGIDKPVLLMKSDDPSSGPAAALGNACAGEAVLLLAPDQFPDFYRLLQGKQSGFSEFLVQHEFSHIAHNDLLKRDAWSGTAGSTMALALRNLKASTLRGKLTRCALRSSLIAIAYSSTLVAVSQMQEKRADLRGFSRCSLEGRQAAIQGFDRMRKELLAVRESTLADPKMGWSDKLNVRLAISPYGDNSQDSFHPPLTERIAYLQAAAEREEKNFRALTPGSPEHRRQSDLRRYGEFCLRLRGKF